MSAYDRLTMKADEQVAEVIQRGCPEEQNDALCCLQERHQAKLLRYVTNRLSGNYHLAEDVTQITWLHVFNYLRVNRIRTTFLGFLFEVAKRRCVDEIRKQRYEWHIEHDVPLPGNIEEDEIEKEQLAIAAWLPFVTTKLSDCQRVVWLLRHVLGFSTGASAKLLGKTKRTISTTLNQASHAWREHYSSQDYDIDLACGESKYISRLFRHHNLILECFSESIKPHIEPDQFRLLNLSPDGFYDLWDVALILPCTLGEDDAPTIGSPYLVCNNTGRLPTEIRHPWSVFGDGRQVLIKMRANDETISLECACDVIMEPEKRFYRSSNAIFASNHASPFKRKIVNLSFVGTDYRPNYLWKELLGEFSELIPYTTEAQKPKRASDVSINHNFPKTGIMERVIRLNNKKLQ